jgi:tetratricopeptide (TPR) repeat protein
LADAAGVTDATGLVVELAAHGLIQRTDRPDEWSFRSELVRQAALRGILGVQRRDYHRLVAEAIVRLHPDDSGWAERLAVHQARAESYLEAARTIFRTGEAHERVGRLERARESYVQGLAWLQAMPERPDSYEPRVQGEATLRLRLGVVQLALGETRHAVAALEVALDIAADAGLPWIESRAHLELGHAQITAGRLAVAAAHLAQARETAPLDDIELLRDILQVSASLSHQRGRNDESEALWREVMRLSAEDPRARARALTGLASRDMRIGDWERAAASLSEALFAARSVGDVRLEARVLNHLGLLASASGRYDDALTAFRRALELRTEIGHRRGVVVNHHDIATVHRARGDLPRAHVSFERSRALAAEIGWEHGVAINEVWLAYLDAPTAPDHAVERLIAATTRLVELGDTEAATTGEWLLGRLYADLGRPVESGAQLAAALAQAQRYGLSALAREIAASVSPPGGSPG